MLARPNTVRQTGSYFVIASFLVIVFVFGVGDDIRNRALNVKIGVEDEAFSVSSESFSSTMHWKLNLHQRCPTSHNSNTCAN